MALYHRILHYFVKKRLDKLTKQIEDNNRYFEQMNKKYTFTQSSRFSEPWEGYLTNIPEDAVFYKEYSPTESQQEWYVFIPNKEYNKVGDDEDYDWNEMYLGEGCVQVEFYELMEYHIIHLQNIKPNDNWVDVGEKKFKELFDDFFKSCYVIEKIPGEYQLLDINLDKLDEPVIFKEIEAPRISSVYRLTGLSSDGELDCIKVNVYNPMTKTEYYCIEETTIQLYSIQDGAYNALKLKKEITHSPKVFNKVFNETVEKLRNGK